LYFSNKRREDTWFHCFTQVTNQSLTITQCVHPFPHAPLFLQDALPLCNAITRQPIELESCSNHLRIRKVF